MPGLLRLGSTSAPFELEAFPMHARPFRTFVLCGLFVFAAARSFAQSPTTGPYCCEAHARQAATARGPVVSRGLFGSFRGAGTRTSRAQGDAYGRPQLPRGQVYYGGRYFGGFNNRFYGPQYGNF